MSAEELEAVLGCALSDADPDIIPSATLCVSVLVDGRVEQYGLGDSPLVARTRYGKLHVSSDKVLEASDSRYERYPRLKPGDDASVYMLRV